MLILLRTRPPAHGPPSDPLARILNSYAVAVTYHPIHSGGFTRLQSS
jgi:hypothetical protein